MRSNTRHMLYNSINTHRLYSHVNTCSYRILLRILHSYSVKRCT